jgi:hypothetical protein
MKLKAASKKNMLFLVVDAHHSRASKNALAWLNNTM